MQAIFKGKQGGGNCPRSEIKCPHSEHRKQETGAKANRISLPHDTTNLRIYLLSRTGRSYSGQSEHG